MKKLVTVFLALAMILAMSIPAFAEDTTVTIQNPDGIARTYVGFQLLELTTSLKGDGHHTAHVGAHTDDCYNFAYTINGKYREILQAETLAHGRNDLWVTTGVPATPAGVTDAQILDYLEYQTSDNGDVYMTMRQVADRLYRAIKDANLDADDEDLTNINQGYWIFADVSTLSGNESNSLVIVDTKGQDAIVINPKTALPTVEKKVKDIEDSEDNSITDNPWHDSADHDIGDTVPFKLTATLPSNAQYYQTYKLIFHDTLSAGLTLQDGTFQVFMYETKYKADVDTDVNDGTDVTDKFTVNTTPTDDCTFEVSCDNVFAITGVTKDTAFVVCYNATLTNDNDTTNGDEVVIGGAGNINTVQLEFSNDPYNVDSTGKTETDNVAVFTYKLVINKTDSHGHELEGAGFTLSKKNVDGTYTVIGAELKGDGMTTFTWVGLDDGDYKLEETTVPDGYNKMSDILFSISAAHSETEGSPQLISLDGGMTMGNGDVATGTITKVIENHTGTVLPETGAEGTFLLITGGTLLVVVAVVFMITRKKMSIYED